MLAPQTEAQNPTVPKLDQPLIADFVKKEVGKCNQTTPKLENLSFFAQIPTGFHVSALCFSS